MIGQRWPGSGTIRTGYGTPGAASLDRHGELVTAKEHRIGGVVNGGTKQLFPPLLVNDSLATDLPLGQSEYAANFLSCHPYGGISADLARALAFESQTLLSPAVLDLQLGRRIAHTPAGLVYADHSFVNICPANGETQTLDMKSPVMQVDDGVVRTRRGLAALSEGLDTAYFATGEFMHLTRLEQQALATTSSGDVVLIDIETGAHLWEVRRSRGSISGWSQALFLSPQEALWTNRYTVGTLDFREQNRGQADKNVVLDYPDRQREIRGIAASPSGDVYALTSYELLWLARGREPVLSVEHPIAKNDWSASLYVGETRGTALATVSSQISPLTTAAFFGLNAERLPVLKDDLYYLESWPTIAPQSHITVETSNGFDLYSVGNEGGLYRQHWIETGASARDALTDLPPADQAVSVPETSDEEPYGFTAHGVRYRPFELMKARDDTDSMNFSSIYTEIFEAVKKPSQDRSQDIKTEDLEANGKHSGDEDLASDEEIADWQETGERQWLDPQRHRLAPAAVDRIRSEIRQMARDTTSAVHNRQPVVTRPDADLRIPKAVQAVLDLWSEDPATEQLSQSQSLDSQPFTQTAILSQPMLSQPTLSQPMLSQPMLSQPTLSQPTLSQPTLSQHKKHRHKRRKHRH